MMKFLKWMAIGVGSLIGLLLVLGFGLSMKGKSKATSAPEVAIVPLPEIPADSALLARGQHVVTSIAGCAGCHGTGLKGQKFDTPDFLVSMASPNLTRGKGGVGDNTREQWLRAMRGGTGRDGRQLAIMPSAAYAHMSDADMAAVLAYLETIPPVDNVLPPRKIGPLGAILTGAGQFPLAADLIASTKPQPSTVQPAVTAEYGGYLVTIGTCADCHGAELHGAPGHGGPPAPSLRVNPRGWTEEAFRTAMRSGKTPEGKSLDPAMMPWNFYAGMTDDELKAIWMYIRGLPAQPAGE